MSRRILFQTGADSPFRMSHLGVDAAGAPYQTLLFDGNSRTLRVYKDVHFENNGVYDTATDTGSISIISWQSAGFAKTFSAPPFALGYWLNVQPSRTWAEKMSSAYEQGAEPFKLHVNHSHWTTTTGLFSIKAGYFRVFDCPIETFN